MNIKNLTIATALVMACSTVYADGFNGVWLNTEFNYEMEIGDLSTKYLVTESESIGPEGRMVCVYDAMDAGDNKIKPVKETIKCEVVTFSDDGKETSTKTDPQIRTDFIKLQKDNLILRHIAGCDDEPGEDPMNSGCYDKYEQTDDAVG